MSSGLIGRHLCCLECGLKGEDVRQRWQMKVLQGGDGEGEKYDGTWQGNYCKPKEASHAWTKQTNTTLGFKKKFYICIPHICNFS